MNASCVVVSKFTKKNQNSLSYLGTLEIINLLSEYEKNSIVPQKIPAHTFSYIIWKNYREVLLTMYDILSALNVQYYTAKNNDTAYTMQIWPSDQLRLGIYKEFEIAIKDYELKRDIWLDFVGLNVDWYSGSSNINLGKKDYSFLELQQIFEEVKINSI